MQIMPVRAARSATDGALARVAATYGGVAGRRHLLAAGASRHGIAERLGSGLLTGLYPGVYAVGCPQPSARGAMWAALLAAGPRAWLSHDSAAWLLDWLVLGATWHVTRVGRPALMPGLVIHGCREMPALETGTVDGVPCTGPGRTLVDLAASRPARIVERCLDEWDRQGEYDAVAIEAATRPGRRGASALRRVIDRHAIGSSVTRNEFEERFLRFLRARRISQAEFNVPLTLPSGTPIVVDAWWSRERVAIELDGRESHARAAAFESDRARDLELLGMGIRPGRVTWRKLTFEPDWVEQRLRDLLATSNASF